MKQVPIYFATGNKCKAFFWGTASGLVRNVIQLLS